MAINLVYPKQPKEMISYYSLLHLGKTSNKTSKVISNPTLRNVAFHTTNNIGSILCNAKERSNYLQKSSVYRIDCSDCNAVYVGKTMRNLDIRYSEHLSDYRNKHPDKSNLAKHLREENHTRNKSNIKLLHSCQNYYKITFLEAFQIENHAHDVNYKW